jgi:probable rRNA maturation factor
MLLARREMDDILGRLLRFFGLARESLEVEMTNDRGIAALNREFLGLAGPTNVLSFPPGDSQDSGFLGSITVSLETVLRESVLYGQDARLHAARMLAHGILHLLGHEHGPSMQERTESAVWEAAGPLPEDGDQLP